MYELALFAGAGGGLLATKWLLGWRCVCAVEKAPYRREVLLRRQRDGLLDLFPIWDDIRTFTKRNNACRRAIKAIRRCRPLVVTAGFPCQPFSVAGKRDWETSDKNLWPETARVISEIRPEFVLLENVPGIRPYLPVVIRDLRRVGYTVERPTIVAAASVGAGHIRKRVWIFAYAHPLRCQARSGRPEPTGQWRTEFVGCAEAQREAQQFVNINWWANEPGLARLVYGVAHRVDRIAALGDGQVPAVVATAWRILTEETSF